MGACFPSEMRRLWFLAVLLCLWPFAAQAITRTPFSLAPEPPQKPSFSSRLEKDVPRQNGPSLLIILHVSPDGRIGLFCGGDPINSFDSNGRLATTAVQGLYAGVAGLINSVDSIAISPFAILEGGIRSVVQSDTHPWWYGLNSAGWTIERGFQSFGAAWDVAQQADFSQLGLLFANQIPILGNFVPGPQGDINGPVGATITSRGIAGNDYQTVIDVDNRAASRLGLSDQYSAPYVGGSVAEVFAEGLMGDTAPGLEYSSEVVDALPPDVTTIDQLDHSGGVIRGLAGSRYLGYYGIGVSQNFSAQGPAIGYYNNIDYIGLNLSPGLQEPTSTIGWAMAPGLFGGETGLGVTSIWNNGLHIQPGTGGAGSVWDWAATDMLRH